MRGTGAPQQAFEDVDRFRAAHLSRTGLRASSAPWSLHCSAGAVDDAGLWQAFAAWLAPPWYFGSPPPARRQGMRKRKQANRLMLAFALIVATLKHVYFFDGRPTSPFHQHHTNSVE